MGSLVLPSSGQVYADSMTLIYSVERHPHYGPLLDPLWDSDHDGKIEVVTSDLSIQECLVIPLRNSDSIVTRQFEDLFVKRGISLIPISASILREAARLRASIPALRTPDAIHAATALAIGCPMFLTNDPVFRRIPALPVTLLDDLLP